MIKKVAFNIGYPIENPINGADYDIIYAFEPNEFLFNELVSKSSVKYECFRLSISDKNGYLSSEVQTIRLDTFMIEKSISHINFLKIEEKIKGLSVIKSIGDLIKNVDIIELCSDSSDKENIINYLDSKGFKLADEFFVSNKKENLKFKRVFIPVIGVPILNGTNWLKRLIDSVDIPVDRLLIINNNGLSEIDSELNKLKSSNELIKKVDILNMPGNIGVASSWNLIIKSFIMKPYWVISNHDVCFTPGLLRELYDKAENSKIDIVFGSGGDFGQGSYDLFLIKDSVVKKIGLFDENCYPAYCEDVDYIMRITRWDWDNPETKINKSLLNKAYYHGNKLSNETDYYGDGSQTKKENSELSKKLDDVNLTNFEYMEKKWGPGWRMSNPSIYPMGIKGIPLTYTSFDIEFVRKKYLGF